MLRLFYKKLKKLNRLFWAHAFTPSILFLTAIPRARREKQFRSAEPRTILISFFGRGLGDSIYFSGVLKIIRSRFPRAKIQLAFLKQLAPYFNGNPYVDEFIACPDYYQGIRGFFNFYQSAWKRRQRGPVDLLLNLCPTLLMLPVFWDFFIQKRYSIGVGDSLKRLFYDSPVPIDWTIHYYECVLRGIEPLGIKMQKGHKPEFWIPAEVDIRHLFPTGADLSKAIIVAPGGRRTVEAPKEYCWTFEEFPDVIKGLLKRGYPVIVTGADYDQEIMDKITAHPNLINLIGKTTILEIFSIVKKYGHLAVCNNSGLMHIAGILGVPTVSYADPKENMIRWCAHPHENNLHDFSQDTRDKKITAGEFLELIAAKLEELKRPVLKQEAIAETPATESNPENQPPS